MNNPPRSQLNYCIWRYFCEITWSQGSRLKKYPSILEGHLVSQEGLMCGPVTSFLTPKSSLCPFFCRLFDLPSLFAVIQEALVTFLGEIHHWDIIHSNSFWARNKKCLKARGFKQTLQRSCWALRRGSREGRVVLQGLGRTRSEKVGAVWGRQDLGTGESAVTGEETHVPCMWGHTSPRGSAHMEMAPLENSGPFSRVRCCSTILCLCGQFSLSACAVSPRYTDNKSGE